MEDETVNSKDCSKKSRESLGLDRIDIPKSLYEGGRGRVKKTFRPIIDEGDKEKWRKRMVTAWEKFLNGESHKMLAEFLGISEPTMFNKFIKPQKWRELRKLYLDGEQVDYPWLALPSIAEAKPCMRRDIIAQVDPTKLELREKRQRAFTMWCAGVSKVQIAEHFKVAEKTVIHWSIIGRWSKAKQLIAENKDRPIDMDIPEEISSMVIAQRVYRDIFNLAASEVATEAIMHVKEHWTPDDVLAKSRDLAALAKMVETVSEKQAETHQHINIMMPVQSVKDQGDFDIELPTLDAEFERIGEDE
jgi:hypothetical protein